MTESLASPPADGGQPPADGAVDGLGDDVETALLEVQRLVEFSVLQHRHRREQDSLITAVRVAEEDIKTSILQLVREAKESIDVVLADAEYVEAARADYENMVAAKEDIHVRVLCTQSMIDVGLIEPTEAERPVTEVRVARMAMLQVVIVDGRAAMVIAPSATGRHASVIRSLTVVRALGILFEGLWRDAAAVEDHIDFGDRSRAMDPRRILECLLAGVTDEVATRELSISVRTYRRYVAEIMAQLGASSRFQAGVRAAELGLLPGSGEGRRQPGQPGAGRAAGTASEAGARAAGRRR